MSNIRSLETVTSLAVYDLYSPFQYPWFCLFFAIWLVSALFRACLFRVKALDINKKFPDLAEDKKRNVLTYVLQILMTTMMFVIQIYGSWDILFRLFEDSSSQDRLNWMYFALQSGCALYLWELIGVPLLVHHLVTILIGQLLVAAFFDTQDSIYIRLGMLFVFHATTEQMSFVAFFCDRLNIFPKWHGFLFYAAAVQSFVIKTLVSLLIAVYFCIAFLAWKEGGNQPTNSNWFWKVCFLPFLILLYFAQLCACKIFMNLRKRCNGKDESKELTSSGVAGGTFIDDSTRRQVATPADSLEV